jgi:hypothetical protein
VVVFRSDTVFNTLAVEQVTSQDMLAAMFGYYEPPSALVDLVR